MKKPKSKKAEPLPAGIVCGGDELLRALAKCRRMGFDPTPEMINRNSWRLLLSDTGTSDKPRLRDGDGVYTFGSFSAGIAGMRY